MSSQIKLSMAHKVRDAKIAFYLKDESNSENMSSFLQRFAGEEELDLIKLHRKENPTRENMNIVTSMRNTLNIT